MSEVTEILRAHREQTITELVSTLVETVPMYALADAAEVRQRVAKLYELFLDIIETHDTSQLTKEIAKISEQRIAQGFSAADFIRGLLLVYPVVRNVIRRAGPRNDAVYGHMFAEVENAVFRYIAVASNIFAAGMTRAAEKKAGQLEEQNELLRQEGQQAVEQAKQHRESLQAAQEFNSRVISSLSAGVVVVEHLTMKIIL